MSAPSATVQPRFSSMEEAAGAMRYWPKDLSFPIRDADAPESILRACSKTVTKEAIAQKKEQDAWTPRMSGRDSAILLAYEDNASRLEAKLGWSALDLWARAYDEMRKSWSGTGDPAPMSKEDMRASFNALVNSGAHMEAAFWTRSRLPLDLANNGLIDEMTLLCEAGFPLDKPFQVTGHYGMGWEDHLFPFASACSAIDCRGSDEEKRVAVRRALMCAMGQGATLEERDTQGNTALGFALMIRDPASSNAFIAELLELGADPTRVGQHPLALCANRPLMAQAVLAAYQSAELEGAALSPRGDGGASSASKMRV